MRILDLCTGTGCIPLLLYALLAPYGRVEATGVDIASVAVRLARRNVAHHIREGALPAAAEEEVRFVRRDVFENAALEGWGRGEYDVVTANPPYVSPRGYADGTTSRGVRNWEPRRALVPEWDGKGDGDEFYPRLTEVAERVRAKVLLMEVGDLEQAKRVAKMALGATLDGRGEGYWKGVEIWRDWMDPRSTEEGAEEEEEVDDVVSGGASVRIRGKGSGRAAVCWTEEGGRMIGR